MATRRTTVALVGAVLLAVALVGAGATMASVGTADDPEAASVAQPSEESTATIEVSTSGDAETQPDEAVVRLSVRAVSDDPTSARSAVGENVSRMRDALAEIGIDEDQIRTTDFDLRERRERRVPREDREPDTEYRASHDFAIEVSDPGDAGEVVDVAIDNGATDVHDIRFTLADDTREELRTQALEEAMTDARSQADTIATSAGLEITGVHAASTRNVRIPRPRATVEAAGDGAAGGTDISTGPVTVSATVSVTYNATEA